MKTVSITLLLVFSKASMVLGDIVIRGSDTLGAKMVPQLVEEYRKLHPALDFQITAEGSSSCFSNLLAGSCDIGMASRPPLETELKAFEKANMKLEEHVVAHHMIAVIVNAQNPIKNLSLKQVEQVFTGETENWEDLGGRGKISVYTRNTTSGTYKTFQNLAMNGRDYGERTQKLAGGEYVPTEVSGNINGIGYTGLAYAMKDGIQAVAIDGIESTAKNVDRYPISRDLFFYTVGKVEPEVRDFIRWVRESEKARGVIETVGFIPWQQVGKKAEP